MGGRRCLPGRAGVLEALGLGVLLSLAGGAVFPGYSAHTAMAAQTDIDLREEGTGADMDEEEFLRKLEQILEAGGGQNTEKDAAGDETAVLKWILEQEGILEDGELADMKPIVNPPMDIAVSGENLVYSLAGGSEFVISIPDGMTTTAPVFFQPVEDARTTITRDGAVQELTDDGIYSRSGAYHVKMLVMPHSGDLNIYEVNLGFTILEQRTSGLNLLKAPPGFAIRKLELDGREIKPDTPDWHFLHRDGRYQVRFEDVGGKGISRVLSVYRDTQAPLLDITPALEKREMDETVYLKLLEEQASVEMYYNGKASPAPVNKLELAGLYQFRLRDGAGNERYYDIRMRERLRPPGFKAVIITMAVAGAAAGWFLYQRKHPRFL